MKEYVIIELSLDMWSGVKSVPVSEASAPLSLSGLSSDWPSAPAALAWHQSAAPAGGSSIILRPSEQHTTDLACHLFCC